MACTVEKLSQSKDKLKIVQENYSLEYVFWRQRTDGSCFLINSVTLNLLTGEFKPFPFRMTFDKCGLLIAILASVFEVVLGSC